MAGNREGVMQSFVARHVFRPASGTREGLLRAFRRTSAGKGQHPAQARTGALCEALERISGCYRGDEPRVRASLRDAPDGAIPPNACMNFSDRQDAERSRLKGVGRADPTWVPAPLGPRRVIDWTPVWSLAHGRWRYLPTAYCYYGHPDAADTRRYCRADSNGNAAGSCLEDAVLQGFLELVERDAVAVWWVQPRQAAGRGPGISADALRGAAARALSPAAPHDAGVRHHDRLRHSRLCRGVHAPRCGLARHPVRVRLSSRCWHRTGACPHRGEPVPAGGPRRGAATAVCGCALLHEAFLQQPRRKTAWSIYPAVRVGDLLSAVDGCVARAAALGLETLVLDQTRSDIGLPVVKVVVPGTRQFWPRLAPGRLYDVPVSLGWQPVALAEHALHTRPFFV